MRITPRPIGIEDQVDHSRDIAGFNKWARSSRTIGFLMFLLGWFTIPMDVLLRRDFGQRWFTAVNFYAGLLLLVMFAGVQFVFSLVWDSIAYRVDTFLDDTLGDFYTSTYEPPDFTDRLLDKSMLFVLIAYLLLGSYHLFKIWWRTRTNTALHSFDDGTSRLEPLAGYLIQIINALMVPFVYLYVFLLPKKQREGMNIPKLINDRTSFTNTVVEPVLLFVLAFKLHGITSLWLFLSAIALAIHANWKETAKLNKILDFRDSVIEAKVMMQLRNGTDRPAEQTAIMQQAAVTIQDNPAMAPQMAAQYPDLMSIIEEMNNSRAHLS